MDTQTTALQTLIEVLTNQLSPDDTIADEAPAAPLRVPAASPSAPPAPFQMGPNPTIEPPAARGHLIEPEPTGIPPAAQARRPARKTAQPHPSPKGNRHSQRKRKARANYTKQPTTHHSLECEPYEVHWAMHGTALNPDTTAIAEYRELSTCSDGKDWQDSNVDEIGRMFQGFGENSYMPTGTNTLWFVHPSQVPKHKKTTYVRVVCADRPEKSNLRRVRWTGGGDRINYPGNKTTKTADLTTSKLMFNSVISTPGGRFMSIDLKDFYLCSDLEGIRICAHPSPHAPGGHHGHNMIHLY
jgi:hypothetical protein